MKKFSVLLFTATLPLLGSAAHIKPSTSYPVQLTDNSGSQATAHAIGTGPIGDFGDVHAGEIGHYQLHKGIPLVPGPVTYQIKDGNNQLIGSCMFSFMYDPRKGRGRFVQANTPVSDAITCSVLDSSNALIMTVKKTSN